MREAEDFLERLRRWYDRPFAADLEPCGQAPLFGDLVEFARSHKSLGEADRIHVSTCPRCQRTLAGIREELRRPLSVPDRHAYLRRRWPAAAGMATAALVGFALLSVRAQRFDLCEIGFAKPVLATGPSLDLTDSETVAATVDKLSQNRAERDEALRIGADPWLPWTQLYRNLRALGWWGEALSETHAFVEFACEQDQKPDRYSMYYSGVFDLGNMYAAIGDYENARDYHERSLAVARDYLKWAERSGRNQDTRPSARIGGVAATLMPRLGALSTLGAAEGELRLAWVYHNQATDLLTEYFRQECIDRGLNVNPSASLVELCLTVVADGDVPHSPVVKVREHILRQARLHRLDRNLDAAEQTLDAAATLPDYPFADESRLDFNEPVERLRIAIARGDFASALQHVDEAAQHTGPREFDGYPSHSPIGIVARAELRFLRGVALAGLNHADPEAGRLIDAALNAVSQAASSLSTTERKRFLRSFKEWKVVRNELP